MAILTFNLIGPSMDFVRVMDGLYRHIPLINSNLHQISVNKIGTAQQESNNHKENKKIIIDNYLPQWRALFFVRRRNVYTAGNSNSL